MQLTLRNTLLEYDGPQVIEATDAAGQDYLGALIDERAGRFLLVGITPERLQRFKAGAEDLRLVMQALPAYLGELQGDELQATLAAHVAPDYLPSAGLFL